MVKLFGFSNFMYSMLGILFYASVCLNMVHTGHAGPTDHSGCSIGHSGQFDGMVGHIWHAVMAQNFENFKNPCLVVLWVKGWCARGEPVRDLLSDMRALQNHRHFGSTSTMHRAICTKQLFLQTKSIIVYFNESVEINSKTKTSKHWKNRQLVL
jgi:hypothetical protein